LVDGDGEQHAGDQRPSGKNFGMGGERSGENCCWKQESVSGMIPELAPSVRQERGKELPPG